VKCAQNPEFMELTYCNEFIFGHFAVRCGKQGKGSWYDC
jgi:hypothetical protein